MVEIGLEAALLLVVAGTFAGALNAVAGGATFFTFPALVWAGLPPLVANATNFVALAPSNLAALPAFRAELKTIGRGLWRPVFIGVIGGIAGAILLIFLGNEIFAEAVPYLMAVATLMFATAPRIRRVVQRRSLQGAVSGDGIAVVGLLIFSIYGGYFGAGLGQIMLAALVLAGYEDFHLANALKNAVISAITLFSTLIYVAGGSVSWPHALCMMAGATAGGFIGGAMSRYVPQAGLRVLVTAFGVFLTGYYFYTR